ncbi:hypothetical protein AB833_04355 [Chromatiales bacterium (ex Bugula neritina AB1)]|nr:hypothetical protein AB833_04355 [Chromatiales bacterium (ex Bugula neritina AB1)]
MVAETSLFSESADRNLIDGILDALIPPNAQSRIPGAGELGIAEYLEKVANEDAVVADAVVAIMDALRGKGGLQKLPAERNGAELNEQGNVQSANWLQQHYPEQFGHLVKTTYMGYYSRADIRGLLGLSSEPTQPNGYAVPIEPPDEMAALTRSVRERGPCFRSC